MNAGPSRQLHARELALAGMVMLAGCATSAPPRPQYGRAVVPTASAAPAAASLAGVGEAKSLDPATPAAVAAVDEIPGSGGTLVPGPNGVVFQPGRSPEELEQPSDPSFFERFKHGWKKFTGSLPSETRAREYYQEGERLFGEKQYTAAARRFKRASKLWPDSELQEDALFMRGEALFFSDHYPSASDSYATLLKKFENSRYLDTAVRRQFAMGRYWEQIQRARPKWVLTPNFFDRTRPSFDTMGNAVAAYDSVRLNDPTGPLADDSLMATANIYFIDERFADADHYYEIVRKDYPKSEYQLTAHILGYQSKLRMYQGSLYDETPLIQARELGRNTLVQFGEQLGDERGRIESSQRWISDSLAEREWSMGQYYENTAHYGAAREYYEILVDKHSESSYAELARGRLGEIGGKPPAPAEKLTWLANMFPGEKAKSEARLANNRTRARTPQALAERPAAPQSSAVTR